MRKRFRTYTTIYKIPVNKRNCDRDGERETETVTEGDTEGGGKGISCRNLGGETTRPTSLSSLMNQVILAGESITLRLRTSTQIAGMQHTHSHLSLIHI